MADSFPISADRGLESDTGPKHESQSQPQTSVAAFRQSGRLVHRPGRLQRCRSYQYR
jgi:hypothetical protein